MTRNDARVRQEESFVLMSNRFSRILNKDTGCCWGDYKNKHFEYQLIKVASPFGAFANTPKILGANGFKSASRFVVPAKQAQL
ncbi:MAG: hypothetical protein AAGD09_10230 [Cyanobacteria bacterium P01_F01_bin.56]